MPLHHSFLATVKATVDATDAAVCLSFGKCPAVFRPIESGSECYQGIQGYVQSFRQTPTSARFWKSYHAHKVSSSRSQETRSNTKRLRKCRRNQDFSFCSRSVVSRRLKHRMNSRDAYVSHQNVENFHPLSSILRPNSRHSFPRHTLAKCHAESTRFFLQQ